MKMMTDKMSTPKTCRKQKKNNEWLISVSSPSEPAEKLNRLVGGTKKTKRQMEDFEISKNVITV